MHETLGREVVLLPLVPVSLVTMLVRTSLKPVDSLLNGVALTFVLAVDDLLVSVALSYRAKGKFVADILPITLVHPVPIEMNKRRPDVRGALILLNICTCFYLINGVYCDGMVALCMITSFLISIVLATLIDYLLVVCYECSAATARRVVVSALVQCAVGTPCLRPYSCGITTGRAPSGCRSSLAWRCSKAFCVMI